MNGRLQHHPPDAPLATDDERGTLSPRSSRAPGMHLEHDLLVAVTMAIAFALLGATTWLWTLR